MRSSRRARPAPAARRASPARLLPRGERSGRSGGDTGGRDGSGDRGAPLPERCAVEQLVLLPGECHRDALDLAAGLLVGLDGRDRCDTDLPLLEAAPVTGDDVEDEPVAGQRGRHLDHAVLVGLGALGERHDGGVLLGEVDDDGAGALASERVALLEELDRVAGLTRRGRTAVDLVQAEASGGGGEHERARAEGGLVDDVRDRDGRERAHAGDRNANGVEVVALGIGSHGCSPSHDEGPAYAEPVGGNGHVDCRRIRVSGEWLTRSLQRRTARSCTAARRRVLR